MYYDPNAENNTAPGEETNEAPAQNESTDTLQDKNAPDELSQPNVGNQGEDEPVGDSD